MPRGKNGSNSTQAPTPRDIPFGGFIDLRLDDDERADFEIYVKGFEWNELLEVLADEIKLGISWDGTSDCYLVTFTSTKHGGKNVRYILTARADDWVRAVALVCYKHTRLLEGDWGRFKPATGRASEV